MVSHIGKHNMLMIKSQYRIIGCSKIYYPLGFKSHFNYITRQV
ncbi:protein of unknown function [Xenorhabdus poinarii G6]|uniref:Uncharacterized protein n=1 Tax=Xenorhabdus poinarii G6 TaxID=1354304 RepID=A0A068R201_9GAMM|nr:protein of unknown function [Xenorhabdus poinarii G6]